MVARDLVHEPAQDLFSRRCFTNRRCSFVRLSGKRNDGVASDCGRQLVPTPRCPLQLARVLILAILYHMAYFANPKKEKIMYNHTSLGARKMHSLNTRVQPHSAHDHTVTNRMWPRSVLCSFVLHLSYFQRWVGFPYLVQYELDIMDFRCAHAMDF